MATELLPAHGRDAMDGPRRGSPTDGAARRQCEDCGIADGRLKKQVLCARCRVLNGVKVCGRCETEKPLHDFGIHPRSADNRRDHCGPCTRADLRDSANRRKYGLSTAEATALRSLPCEACGSTETSRIDHCHASGVVRGPLCNGCNMAFGLVGESVEALRGLIAYAEKHAHLKVVA